MQIKELAAGTVRLELMTNGTVQVRLTKENGEYHRFVLTPNDAVTGFPTHVSEQATQIVTEWRTPERVAVFEKQLQENIDA